VSFIRQADDVSLTIFRRFDEAAFIVFGVLSLAARRLAA